MLKYRHNNIVNLISVSLEGNGNIVDSLVIFMEFCAGGDLEKLITARKGKGQVWTQEEILACLDQLITGFVYLQNNGVAHRDVKPQNIFVENDTEIYKIGDLGSSIMVTGEDFSIVGTLSYLSPKVRQGFIHNNYGPTRVIHDPYKSDVYSLGLILLYMAGKQDEELNYLDGLQERTIAAINAVSNDYSIIKILLAHMLQF